jgi:hypothetical protein
MSEGIVAKFLKHLDVVIVSNDELTSSYHNFLRILENEEKSIIDHNILEYEANGKAKEEVGAEIMSQIQRLLEACGDICELAEACKIEVPQVEKLSDVISVFSLLATKIQMNETTKQIFVFQVEKAQKSISNLIETQTHVKEYTERNVMLVNKLLNNHRQSYQFWREAIAAEAVGYNSKGIRNTSHSVSMFNARA